MEQQNRDTQPDNTGIETKVAAFACGPQPTCPDGTQHDYSAWENDSLDDGAMTGTAVCIKCGHRAIDDAMWM